MRVYLLMIFVFLQAGLLQAQRFEVENFYHDASDISAQRFERTDVNGYTCAIIMVRSNVEGLQFDSNIGITAVEAKEDAMWLYVSPGERALRFMKQGFITLDYALPIRPEASRVYILELVATDLPLAALPVTIRITPADAMLIINGKQLENIGPHMLGMGEHTIQIEKEGFQTIERVIDVNERNIFFEYVLERQPDAGLQIETSPDGATVYLDGINLGESPVAVFYKPGTYPIRIVKDGFVTIENQTLEVKLPNTRQSYTLEENVGYLTINTHTGATVFFNEQRISNPKDVKLPPQLVRVKVSMPKAETLEQQVVLRRNDRLTLDMFPNVQTGSIQVAVTPFDAKIELTGDGGEKYSAEGMKVFEDIPVGAYTIKVSAAGHESKEETVTLKSGERESRSVRLAEAKAAQASVPASRQDAVQNKDLKIGDRAHGGIVFYLDGKGGGLVCADSDQSASAQWGCYGTNIGVNGTGIGTGAANTAKIVARCREAGTAARICNNLVLNGYSDWFLPSKGELNLMYQNLKRKGVGGFAENIYWSSSESNSNVASRQNFANGRGVYFVRSAKSDSRRVRAVRAF